jgi:Brp/Blh family beta-carotene 15,15'-monooxygenase
MNAQRFQGSLFCLVALVGALATFAIERFTAQSEIILLAVLILLLGIPHGALDTVFAHRLYGIRSLWGWLGFSLVYLFLAGLVVGLWWLAPVVFLGGFLLISIAHFSGDPAAGTPFVSRILYAGAVIIFPSFLHGAEMSQLFSYLVGADAAQAVIPVLGWLAWPWLLGLVLAVLESTRRDRLTALEMASVAVLTVLAPPLVSFTLFFCGMHSARHIIRTAVYAGSASLRLLVTAALLPMLGVVLVSAGAWYFLKDTPVDARVLQIVFVGLAALTVPHMALVERVRVSGWLKGAMK